MKKALLSTLTAALVVLLQGWIAPPAEANSIVVWQTPVAVNINDPTQVITTSSTVGPLAAIGAEEGPQTVNGVAFPVMGALGSNISITGPIGGVGPFYGPANSPYSLLLAGGAYIASGNTANIVISNLTPGVRYEVQIFTPYWDADYQSQYSDGTNSVPMGNTHSQPTYVIGTFTAGTATETIFATAAPASSFGITAAAQVLALPEPASGALLVIGSLVGLRRRRSA